jgi:hypothetical protein
MRHVALRPNCKDLTRPTLLPFALPLSSLSLFLSPPTLLLLSLSLHLPLSTDLPPLLSPASVLHKPEHNTQLKTMCPKATYSEPQDRLRDFRDCLWVLYTIRYLCHAAYLSLHLWTHIFLSRLSRLPAGFLYIHEVTLYLLVFLFPFSASCYLICYIISKI